MKKLTEQGEKGLVWSLPNNVEDIYIIVFVFFM